MKTLLVFFGLAATLVGCENLYDDSDIPGIRSQVQADAYNETVSSEGEKLVCTREKPLGSMISKFFCMTVDQQERFRIQSREDIELVGRNQRRQ